MNRTMMKSFALLILFCGILVSAIAAPKVSAVDTDGKTVSLASPAKRIVSLSPAATETLFAIGAGSKLVGVTTYCNYPEEAKALQKVGEFSASTISVEMILSLKPDLVVTAGMMHRELEPQFARLGIKFFSYDPATFMAIADGMRSLGILAGKSAEAEKAAVAMIASIESVKKTLSVLKPEERPSVFWEMYDEPLMTCGASTFQHAIIEAAGGKDIFSNLPGAHAPYGFWVMVGGMAVLCIGLLLYFRKKSWI